MRTGVFGEIYERLLAEVQLFRIFQVIGHFLIYIPAPVTCSYVGRTKQNCVAAYEITQKVSASCWSAQDGQRRLATHAELKRYWSTHIPPQYVRG